MPAGFLPLSSYPEKRLGYDGLVFCGEGHSLFNAAHQYPSPQAAQIAAFIVRACNSHHELLAALEAVELARMSDAPADWQRATDLTDAALAKAGAA